MANEDPVDPRSAGNGPKSVATGFISLVGGMNAGLAPSLISDATYNFGVNISSRGGLVHTRPPFIRFEAYIPAGKFQGAALYRKDRVDRIIFCVDGVVWSLNLDTYRRYRIGAFPTTDFDRAFFCQADKYMVIQNGIIYPENWPIIIDGDFVLQNSDIQYFDDTAAWKYLGDHATYSAVRVPIGTAMAYVHGRLFVAVPRLWDAGQLSGSAQWLPNSNRRSFLASDIFQSDNPSEFLAFIESTYLSGGGAIAMPASLGSITAMTMFRNAPTGTGLGDLVVFGSEGVCAYGVGADRAQWQNIDLAQVMFLNSGTESPNAVVSVNDDIVFRASDGLRFVRYTGSQVASKSGGLSNVAQSLEVSPVIELDSRVEVPFVSIANVNNRVYMTSAGEVVGDQVLFDALISLDTSVANSVTELKVTPEYDGIWTGHKFLQILKARYDNIDRAFMFVKVDGTRNELWYVDDAPSSSEYRDGKGADIQCQLITRSYDFELPRNTKIFQYCEQWVSNAKGSCALEAYWRSDSYLLWGDTLSYHFNSDIDTVDGALPQSRWRVRLPVNPVFKYDPVSGRDTRVGATFQFALKWTGAMTLEKTLFHALPITEASPTIGCTTADAVPLIEGTGGSIIDNYEYAIPPLTALTDIAYWDALTLGREPLFYWVFDHITDNTVYGTLTVVGPTGAGGNFTFKDVWFDDGDGEFNWEDAAGGFGDSDGGYGSFFQGGGSGGAFGNWVPTLIAPPLGYGDTFTTGTKLDLGTGLLGPTVQGGKWWKLGGEEEDVDVEGGTHADPTGVVPPPVKPPQPGSPESGNVIGLDLPSAYSVNTGKSSEWQAIKIHNYSTTVAVKSYTLDFTPMMTVWNDKVTWEFAFDNAGSMVATLPAVGSLAPGGEAILFARVTCANTWLTTEDGSPLSQKVTLDVTWDGTTQVMSPGDGETDVVTTVAGVTDAQRVRAIAVEVVPQLPEILAGADVVYNVTLGDTAAVDAYTTVANSGAEGSILAWAATIGDLSPEISDAVTFVPSSGSINTDTVDTITVTLDPTGLVVGTYTGIITITGASCVEDETIDVTVNVADAAPAACPWPPSSPPSFTVSGAVPAKLNVVLTYISSCYWGTTEFSDVRAYVQLVATRPTGTFMVYDDQHHYGSELFANLNWSDYFAESDFPCWLQSTKWLAFGNWWPATMAIKKTGQTPAGNSYSAETGHGFKHVDYEAPIFTVT